MSGRALYRSYRTALTQRFGTPVGRIVLNAGFSCPNRDGTLSREGCAFCDMGAFSPAATDTRPLRDQIDAAVVSGRYRCWIAYFQPGSNTWGPVARIRRACEEALAHPCIAGIAIGTRPDCLATDVLDYLGELATRTSLCVEIGVQSMHDATLVRMRRGHTADDVRRAALACAARGIEAAAHVIVGLPGEGRDEICATASALAAMPFAAVKIHQLMIVEGTTCAIWWREGCCSALSIEEYAPLLGAFLQRLRPDQYVLRIMADATPSRGLLAPLWSADKARSIAFLREYLRRHDMHQGDCFGCPDTPHEAAPGRS